MRKMIGGNLARENSKFSENSDLKMRVHKRKKEENDESEQKNQIKKKSCESNGYIDGSSHVDDTVSGICVCGESRTAGTGTAGRNCESGR